MGNKTMHKIIAVFVAAAMIMTCGIGVFAEGAGSPTKGQITTADSTGASNGKSLTVTWQADKAADKYIVQVGGSSYTATGTSLTVATSPGATYDVYVTPVYGNQNGATYSVGGRWMKTTKLTKAKSGKKKVKLRWKKAKGATKYQVLVYKDGVWQVVKTVKGTKATIKLAKGKYQFKVRPMKGNYAGVRSNTKKAKAK